MAGDIQGLLATAAGLQSQVNALLPGGGGNAGGAAAGGGVANAPAAGAAANTATTAAPAAGGDAVANALAQNLEPSALVAGPVPFNYTTIGDSLKSMMMVVKAQSKVVAAKQAILSEKARQGNLDASEVALHQIDQQVVANLSQLAKSVHDEQEQATDTWLR